MGLFSQRMGCMNIKFMVDYKDTPFLKTSKTAAHPNRLNWRTEILLTRNMEAIRDKSVLDLASHDGRFSYACLKLGASNVTGVEGRRHLVESATENLMSLGCKPNQFSFIQDEVFNYLPRVKLKEFDTILCFGFFYHTVRQTELLEETRRIHPAYFILDTHIERLLNKSNPIVKLAQFIRISPKLKELAERLASSDWFEPCLVFKHENPGLEGATTDASGLIAWPSKTFIEFALTAYGFSFREMLWDRKEIKDWTAIGDYKTGERISYIAQPVR